MYVFKRISKEGAKFTCPKFAIVLNGLFIVFLKIVGEVVDRDVVVLNVLHDLVPRVSMQVFSDMNACKTHPFLEPSEFSWRQRI